MNYRISKAKLERLYLHEGLSTGQIVARTGVPATTITRLRAKWGISTRNTVLVGRQFGRLTVLAENREGQRGAPTTCRCLCACGREVTVQRGNLQQGATTSCGCLRSERLRRSDGAAVRMSVLREYQRSAQRKGLDWGLTDGEAFALFEGACWYCGVAPSRTREGWRHRLLGSYTFNGIDRRDSRQGYVPGNTVSCCPECNYAKGRIGASEFVQHVRVIRQEPLVVLAEGRSDHSTGWAFAAYRANARVRHLPFALTRAQVTILVSSPCAYCGAAGSSHHGNVRRNGIDRLDSTKGYEPGNCAPCCAPCNQIKGKRTVRAFLAWATRVGGLVRAAVE